MDLVVCMKTSVDCVYNARRKFGKLALVLLAGLMAGLPACSPLENLYYLTRPRGEAQDAYRHTREYAAADRAGLGLLTEKIGANGLELRRLLPNNTVLPGDNYIAYLNFSYLGLKPPAHKALEVIKPLPYPFEFVTERDFRARADSEGEFLFASFLDEGGITCVLAVRVIDFFGPELAGGPRDTAKIVRNCVRGNLEDALGPMVAFAPQDDWYRY